MKEVDIMNISKRTMMISRVTLLTAFLIVASYLVIPLPFAVAAISVQTLAVNLIALLLPPVEAGVSIFVYILLGAVGLPVFNGGNSGIGYLLGPTGGFFIGFLVAVILISVFKGKTYRFLRYVVVTVFIGIPVLYVFAVGWMVVVTGMSVPAAFSVGCIPFLPMDVVKCVLASLMAKPLLNVMKQYERKEAAK